MENRHFLMGKPWKIATFDGKTMETPMSSMVFDGIFKSYMVLVYIYLQNWMMLGPMYGKCSIHGASGLWKKMIFRGIH